MKKQKKKTRKEIFNTPGGDGKSARKSSLSDLFRFCCQMFSLGDDESVSDNIGWVGLGQAVVCHVFASLMGPPGIHPIRPRCRGTTSHGGRPCRVFMCLRSPASRLEAQSHCCYCLML